MRLPSFSLPVIFAVVLGASAGTQQNPVQANVPAPADTQFTARTDLVSVPVVVTDRSGKHLTGIKQSDFVIEENGHRREIATFEEINSVTAPFKASVPSTYQYTNYISTQPQQMPRVTIIVLDLLNTPFIRQASMRQQTIHFLATHVENTGPISLAVLTGRGLQPVHSFTSDTAVLIAALKRVDSLYSGADQIAAATHSDPEADSIDDPATETDMTSEVAQMQTAFAATSDARYTNYRQKEQTITTLEALEEIAQAYAGIPGRKSLFWATEGLPFLLNDPGSVVGIDSSLMSNYSHAWQALNNASIAVYPIDPQGLQSPSLSRRDLALSRPPTSRTQRASTPLQTSPQQNTRDSLNAFAQATGGKPCYNTNDLVSCFARANDDSSQYYLLSYYLPADDRKPGWRKLKVVVGVPHAEVRARDGFFVGDSQKSAAETPQTRFTSAALSAIDYSSVPLGCRIKSVTSAPDGKHTVVYVLGIQPGGAMIDEKNDHHVDLVLNAVAQDDNGKVAKVFERVLKANLSGETLTTIERNGFGFTGNITLPAGKFRTLKFLVRDNLSGKIGTVTAPLQMN